MEKKEFFEKIYLVTGYNVKHLENRLGKDLDQLINSILDKLATKIKEETYTENREEDNLVEHIVNEIRKFAIALKEQL